MWKFTNVLQNVFMTTVKRIVQSPTRLNTVRSVSSSISANDKQVHIFIETLYY